MSPGAVILTMSILVLPCCPAVAADAENGRSIFKVCAPCHSVESTVNKAGPSLKGVFGRRAGSVTEFRYSKAMQDTGQAGLVWNEQALAEFLASPKKKVPGTSMRFWGFWFQSEIDDMIAYLKSAD